jgi:tetratricopeptide (TPR) repeat protein
METRTSEKSKILAFPICVLNLALFLSGCAAFQVGSDVQQGRYALMRGDSKVALAHFQQAARADPGYFYRIGPIKEGVWTYVGRAEYAGGDFTAAQKSLEQARSRHPDDPFAPLYLGLALSRGGDQQTAAKEIRLGLNGLNDWLEYISHYSIDKAYWDPGAIIRSEIQSGLARIEGKEINWPELVASAERVGMDVEREAEEAKREMRRERRDSAKGDDRGN